METTMDKQMAWPSIVLLYVLTLASMGAVGVIAALTLDLGQAYGVAKKDVGLSLAMFSLPSALAAIFCGGVVDRIGAKRVIIVSSALSALANAVAVLGGSMGALTVALAISGVGFTGISVAAPALIVSATSGARRVRGMSLWSTYAPIGFALGLLLAAPFAGSGRWIPPLVIHGTLMAALALAALTLPNVIAETPRLPLEQLRNFARVLRQVGVLRLAAAAAIPSAISYGTSLIAPAYLAETYHVAIGASATAVAVAKAVALLLCGIATGSILARKVKTLPLFAGLAALGAAAQLTIFWPGSGFALAAFGLFAWLIAFGGLGAVAMALLPTTIRDASQSGVASGAIGQTISILSFMAPSIYFGMGHWMGFVGLAAVGLLLAVISLPAWRGAAVQVT